MLYLSGQVGYVATMLQADPTLPLGVMLTPRMGQHPPPGAWWAADNGCFAQGADFDGETWLDWLAQPPGPLARCLFAVMPDVYGDAVATRDQYGYFLPDVKGLGYPVGFVAQNGETVETVPWHLLDCLFIGGTDRFKLSEAAHQLVAAGKAQDKWVHIGRVNSRRRLRSFAATGADSVDGTLLRYDPARPIATWVRECNAQGVLL